MDLEKTITWLLVSLNIVWLCEKCFVKRNAGITKQKTVFDENWFIVLSNHNGQLHISERKYN